MSILTELARVVFINRLHKTDQIPLYTEQNDTDNSYTRLYHALNRSINTPESTIVKALGWNESSAHYRMFKSRFLKRLQNALMFLDASKNGDPYRVKHYNARRVLQDISRLRKKCMHILRQNMIKILICFLSLFLPVCVFSQTINNLDKIKQPFVEIFGGNILMGYSHLNIRNLKVRLDSLNLGKPESDFYYTGGNLIIGNEKALMQFNIYNCKYLWETQLQSGSWFNMSSIYFGIDYLSVLHSTKKIKLPGGIGFGYNFHTIDYADTFPINASFTNTFNPNSNMPATIRNNGSMNLHLTLQPQLKTAKFYL